MATSTPVDDTVATSSSVAPPVAQASRPPVKFLLIAMLIGAVVASLGFSGAIYYLVRSGRLSVGRSALKAAPPVPVETHLLVLDPLLVNLADQDANAYLRLSLTLQVADAAKKKPETKDDKDANNQVASVRDTILSVLGRQTADSLLDVDGKERLKAELKQALVVRNDDLKVQKIFFTEFLIQR